MQGHTLGSDARDWVMANIRLLWSNTECGISPQKHWLIWDGLSSSRQHQTWLFSKTSTSELGLMKMQWKITRVRTSFLVTKKNRLRDSLAELDSLGLFWQISIHSALSHCHSHDQDTSGLYPVKAYFKIRYFLDQLITVPHHRENKTKKTQQNKSYYSYFENSWWIFWKLCIVNTAGRLFITDFIPLVLLLLASLRGNHFRHKRHVLQKQGWNKWLKIYGV